MSLIFSKEETAQYFLNAFYVKVRLFKSLLRDMEPLEKCFLTKMKKANRAQNKFIENSTKDRMTHFKISVAVERCRNEINSSFYVK